MDVSEPPQRAGRGPAPIGWRLHSGLWRSLVSASVWGTEGREFKSPQPDHPKRRARPFWLSCWSGRNVGAVEVNGYTIEPGAMLVNADLERVDLYRANLSGTSPSDLKP